MENNKKNSFVMGSFYKIINKDIKELNGIVISLFSVLFLVGVGFISYILTNNSYALFGDSLTGSKTIGVEASLPPVPAVDTIISKVGIDGLVEESHPATSQLEAVTDYRYTGANPNNYVSFNNELWRIIGVFPTDDGTGNIENRIKIIRNEVIGDYSWDETYYINNWETASLNTYLKGEYYDNLTSEVQNMIGEAKWYLGGTDSFDSESNGLASHWYTYERGTTVYSGNPTSFIGEVGLMYPSDYGYATSGGSTTSREECLAKELYNWSDSNYSDCKNNDWLYDSSSYQWTITPYSGNSYFVFYVYSAGFVNSSYFANTASAARPVLYLDSMVEITGGTGTSSDPYTLGI